MFECAEQFLIDLTGYMPLIIVLICIFNIIGDLLFGER